MAGTLAVNPGRLIACALLALLLAACINEEDRKHETPAPGERVVEVGVVTVQPRRITYTTELAGRTAPFQIAEVRPQISGIIQKRLFTEGSDVRAGTRLYKIDPDTYQALFDSAKAALARAEANMTPARLKKERLEKLLAIRAVSRQDYEDAETAFKQAQADVAVNRAAMEHARIRLRYTNVTSPISGRIGRSAVTPGALVTENQAAPLVTVQQLDPMYVDMTRSLSETLHLKRRLSRGELQRTDTEPVRLRLDDGSLYAGEGRLQFSEASVDESTGTVTLRAIFPNPREELLPGMYVRAILKEGVNDHALLIPQRALVRDAQGRPTALVANDGRVAIRRLEVSRSQDDAWVVDKGLEPGDRVIVEGLQKVRTGTAVSLVELDWAMPGEPAAAPTSAPPDMPAGVPAGVPAAEASESREKGDQKGKKAPAGSASPGR